MTRGRRFFIFLSSAGIMSAFLLFTLSVRKDKPLEKYLNWLPNAKVISINLDIGSLDISNGLEDLEIKNTVIKKTNKVIFLKTIITDNEKNNSQLTSVWSLNETI